MHLVEAHPHDSRAVEVSPVQGLPGLVLHRGTHIHDAFEPHYHAEAHIAFILDGGRVQVAGGQRHRVGAGDLLVIPSGEVHGGASPAGEGWSFAAVYCAPQILAESIAELADEPGIRSRELSLQVVRDCSAGRALLTFAAAQTASTLAAQTQWTHLLAHLLRDGGEPPPARRERAVVRRVRDFLDEHLTSTVTLDQLTALVHVSKEYLVRSFTADLGMPPHTYQIHARIERAKPMLLRGDPISEVAVALGFHDQSHLARHFTRLVGITPGRFAPPRRRR